MEPDFRMLFESALDSYLVLLSDAPKFTIVGASAAYLRATRTTREQLLGRPFFDVFPDSPGGHRGVPRDLRASLERVIRYRAPDTLGAQKSGSAHEELWLKAVNFPLFDSDDRLIYIVHRVQDVTELVLMKQCVAKQDARNRELRDRMEQVDQDVLQRAHALQEANERLREANKELSHLYEKAKELDELKTQFFATVSHELRAPLSMTLGPAERMARSPEAGEQERQQAEIIARNARSLHRHVDHLLQAAKLDAGQMVAEYAEVDLGRLTRFTASLFESRAAERNLSYQVDVPEELWAEIDPDKVQRILMNVLTNAFNVTPEGGTVRLSLKHTGSEHVTIETADSGPGIPKDQRSAVFEPYRSTRGGTGLGLSIVRDFVALHQGLVTIDDAKEGGALVSVTLPLRAPPGTRVLPKNELSETAAYIELEGLRRTQPAPSGVIGRADAPLVLVVEDNPEMNAFLRESLAADYRVAAAFDGKEGLTKALELRPDLLIADLMVPELNGHDLVRALRREPLFADLPIVVITGRADEAIRLSMLEEGAQDYLLKPFLVEELRARVANLLRAKAVQDSLRASETRYRELFENASEGIFIAELSGRFIEVNPTGCQLLGYSCEELLERSVVDVTTPDQMGRLLEIKKGLLRGRSYRGEWLLRKKDQSTIPVEVSTQILPDGRWQTLVRDVSRRKKVERALRRSEALFAGVVSISADAIITVDARQHIVIFNAGAERIFGYSKVEAIGAPLDLLIPEQYRPIHRLHLERFATSHEGPRRMGEHGELTIFGRRKGGEQFPAEATISRLEVNGEVMLSVVLRDVTERRRTEDALRLAEATSTGILSISPDAIISADERRLVTRFNKGAEKLFGYEEREMLGQPLEILFAEHCRAAHRDAIQRFEAGTARAESLGKGLTGRRKDGEEFPVDTSISKLDVDSRRVLTVVIRDITTQQRLEDELRLLSEASAIFNSSLDYEMTLTSVAELVAQKLADVCIIDLPNEASLLLRKRVVSREPALRWACEIIRKYPLARGDHPIAAGAWAELSAKRSVLFERATPEHARAFARSPEHLRAIQALDVKSAVLSPLVVQNEFIGVLTLLSRSRTWTKRDVELCEALGERAGIAIEHARLYHTAQLAVRARDEVLSVVAHDLRNPLNTIAMQSQLLARLGDAHEACPSGPVQSIQRSVTRMSRMIQDLLEVARLEAGILEVRKDRVSARRITADAVESQKPFAHAASLSIELELAKDLPDVLGDQGRLVQVLENLIGNAIKFSGPGKRVTVGARRQGEDVLFWVSDNGEGIPAAALSHIFDRFWQARKTRAGAGLGLPIVKGLVEAHGGHVHAESTVGKGTTVCFTIPAVPRREAPAEIKQLRP